MKQLEKVEVEFNYPFKMKNTRKELLFDYE